MKKKWFLLFIAVGLLATGTVKAETLSLPKSGKGFMSQEIVVSATKTREKRKDISNSVVLIEKKEIEDSAAETLGELLANHPGLDTRTYGNYGGAAQEIKIRGMSADGTQVFINGINVNSISLGTADIAKIPLDSIERIEVVKGAGSLLYGSGASGGIINVFTKKPDKEQMELTVKGSYGNQETYDVSVQHGMSLGENTGYYLTLGQNGTDGFRVNSDLLQRDASLHLFYDKGDTFNLSIYGDYVYRDYGSPGVVPPAGTADYFNGAGVKIYNDEAASLLNRYEEDDAHVAVKAGGKVTEKLSYSLLADYSYSKSYYYDRTYSNNKTWVTNQVNGIEGNLVFHPVDGTELLVGGEYEDYDNENEMLWIDDLGDDIPGTGSASAHEVNSKAAFAELQHRFNKYLKVNGGVRYEDNSIFGDQDIVRYGLVVNATDNTAIKFNRGSHFKAPTMNDLFWPDDGFTKGNTDLLPETGWHTDVTLEQEFADNVFVTVGYFHWDVNDKIAWAEDPDQPTLWGYYWVPTNLNKYDAEGIEVSAVIGSYDGARLALSYTYTDAKEEVEGADVRAARYVPEHLFRGDLSYSHSSGFTIAPTVTYTGKRPYYAGSNTSADPTEYLNDYWLVDLKISQKLNDNWTVSAQGNNLFDESYETYLASFFDRNTFTSTLSPYPGAGRSFVFSVAYTY